MEGCAFGNRTGSEHLHRPSAGRMSDRANRRSASVDGDTYLGSWQLIPELCNYQQGEAPRSGLYVIAESAGALRLTVDWVDRAGLEHHIEFGGLPDGSEQKVDTPGLTHMTLTRVDSRTLDSAAYLGGERVMYARRVAHANLLSTLQRMRTPAGEVSIFQVYRRAAD